MVKVDYYNCPACGGVIDFDRLVERIPFGGGLDQYPIYKCKGCGGEFESSDLNRFEVDEDESFFEISDLDEDSH